MREAFVDCGAEHFDLDAGSQYATVAGRVCSF
jgi:hypothetical protein